MQFEMTPLIVAAVMCLACWVAAAVAVKMQWKTNGATRRQPLDPENIIAGK
jgi:hypothetical protein